MRRWFLLGLALAAPLAVACGSRTGLFADETGNGALAGSDGGALADGSVIKPLACTPGQFTLTRASGQLVFVLDRSGSMQFTLGGMEPSDKVPSKWNLLRDALTPVLKSLGGEMEVGAKFFPAPIFTDPRFVDPIEACQVDTDIDVIPAKGTSGQKIIDVFNSTQPRGGTPTSDALTAAASYLSSPARRSVSRFIVLATDGAPNCNGGIAANPNTCVCTSTDPASCKNNPDGKYSCLDDTRTVATLHDIASKQKIPSYVLGLGSPERPAFVDTLDRMAIAGERPRAEKPFYYDIQTSAQLNQALEKIQQSVSRCSFVTPSRPDDPEAIDISLDGNTVSRDPGQKSGWDWIDRDFGQIEFFGDVCEALATAGPTPNVSATVRCKVP